MSFSAWRVKVSTWRKLCPSSRGSWQAHMFIAAAGGELGVFLEDPGLERLKRALFSDHTRTPSLFWDLGGQVA